MFDIKEAYKPIYDYLGENPNAYFATLAGGRMWVFNPGSGNFTASDNNKSILEANDPLLRTEVLDGIEIMPLLKFDDIDQLLEYISTKDIQEEYFNVIHAMGAQIAQQIELQRISAFQQMN